MKCVAAVKRVDLVGVEMEVKRFVKPGKYIVLLKCDSPPFFYSYTDAKEKKKYVSTY